MIEPMPQPQTLIFIALFIVFYVVFLMRKTIHGDLDLHDLMLLSTVAVVPGVFAFLPGLSFMISSLIGVAFPFVVLFGVLFVIIFVFLHRLTVQNYRLQRRTRTLVQELALLRQELEATAGAPAPVKRGEPGAA